MDMNEGEGNAGGRGSAGQRGIKGGKWDNCNNIINKIYLKNKNIRSGPSQVVELIGVSSHTPKGSKFDPQAGHIPGLPVLSLVRVCIGGNWSMFLSLSISFF